MTLDNEQVVFLLISDKNFDYCFDLSSVTEIAPLTSSVKTIQTDRWHHLVAISCNEQGTVLGGGGCSTYAPFDAKFHHGYVADCLSSFHNRSQ